MKCYEDSCNEGAEYLPVLIVDFSPLTAKGMRGYFGVHDKQSCRDHCKGSAREWMTTERVMEMKRTLEMAGQEMQPITASRLEFWPIHSTRELQIIK